MHRYLIDGMLRDMRAGHRVLCVTARQVEAHSLFDAILRRGLRNDEAYRRVNCDLRFKQADGAGTIYLRSAVSRGHRGLGVDVLVLTEPHLITLEQRRDLMPCIDASSVPQAERLVVAG